ncbi:MAG: glycosyl hydrolase family 28-related protein [Rhizomicrobium sp.]|nr:glycosyl hydrolase family 28-related protein [Rhizomicrobium sp.]
MNISRACFFGFAAALTVLAGPALATTSVFATAPSDPRAITVVGRGDGIADDTAALQTAIDRAGESSGGIVFLPSGRYRISRTILVWPGVRLYGTGPNHPTLVLANHTPGFQRGVANMMVFTGAKRGVIPHVPFPPPTVVPFDPKIADANSSTFYSAISNVDVEIGSGNPAAAAIRFRVAQHAFLSHMDLRLGSGFAGIYQAGNLIRDVHFHGGRYGIVTEKTSPAWQFMVVDSSFDGQRAAAIREHEVGLTLVNVVIRNVPVGIDIDRGYDDQLWGKDVRFEQVKKAAIIISNETNVYTQIGFENALAADTPVFARFRDSGKTVDGKGRFYRVAAFSHGLALPGVGQMGRISTTAEVAALDVLPLERAPAIRALPAVSEWSNVHDLGVVGDGKADDTVALQRAIDNHRVVYLPSGFYKVTDTLHLKPHTVLIALHPTQTEIFLPDQVPGYQGVATPKPLIESAAGGDAIISGVGLYTGDINPRATALLWLAGADSLVEDIKFQLALGKDFPGAATSTPFGAAQTATPSPSEFFNTKPSPRWDGQYPSLWVTKGGGGTFIGCWSPNTFAGAGFYISDTTTPGHAYEMSVEHHVRHEIVLDRVANWEFLAPQTEEEYRESGNAVSLEIRDSHDILIANYHAYRVTRTLVPARSAVEVSKSSAIHFHNVHVNGESGYTSCEGEDCITYLRANKFPYENAIVDVGRGLQVREREFASLDISSNPMIAAAPTTPVVAKLADGFFALGGGAVDSRGTLYFVDRIFQRIYSWAPEPGLRVVNDHPLDAVNLAVDHSDNLLVLSSAGFDGAVFSLNPDGAITPISQTPTAAHPPVEVAVPVNWWVNGEFRDQYDPAHDHFKTLAELFTADAATAPRQEYVSPDGSLVLPAYHVVHQGPPDNRGWRFSHALDSYGFIKAVVGTRAYISNESEARTYTAKMELGGGLSDLKPFAERGGESVVADSAGRVYVANGQIFVYSAKGEEVGQIDVPERPLQLVIGGANHQTLFILTHHALYAVNLT